jgi:hypothetical protein
MLCMLLMLMLPLPLQQRLNPLPLNGRLKKRHNLGQLNLLILRTPQDIKQPLRIQQLLRNDRIRLTKRPDPHDARIRLGGINNPQNGRRRRRARVKLEVVDVHAHEVELRLHVVAESDDFGPALALPVLGDFFQAVGLEPACVELRRDVVVEGGGQGELELAVEKALLARAERDGQLPGGGARLVVGFA